MNDDVKKLNDYKELDLKELSSVEGGKSGDFNLGSTVSHLVHQYFNNFV